MTVRIAHSAIALLVLVLAFLPWAVWLGTANENEAAANTAAVRGWLLWLAIVLPLATILVASRREAVEALFGSWLARVLKITSRAYAWGLALLMAVATVLLSDWLFARAPHLVDTIAQLFHARIFASGALTAPVPEHFEFFAASHLVRHFGSWFSQYPPGHPALLSIGLLAGAPWLVNPLFSAGTLLLLFGIARRTLGEGSARLAALLYLISPFALFMGASYMNHVTSAFFLALALYAVVRAMEGDGGYRWPLLGGIALGAAAAIRPLEAAAWAGVLGLWLLTRGQVRATVVVAVACAVSLTPLLAYNAATTGAPLRFGYTLLWGEGHGLGFHTDPWGEPFTPVVSFANTALDFQRLNVSLFGLPFPSLIFIAAALLLPPLQAAGQLKAGRASLTLLALLLLAAPAAFFFYWHRDNYLGPRFLYASLLPAVLLSAAGIVSLDRWLGRWRGVLRLTLLAGVLYALALQLPESAGIISGQEPELKIDPEARVEEAGIEEPLLLVKVSWGSRLIGRLWGWGVPASETERSFRKVDGCRLQLALDRADSLAAQGADSAAVLRSLRSRLAAWRALDLPVRRDILPDQSVRVDTTVALTGRCRAEAARDASGYTVYGSLVWRQDPWLHEGIIYARDLGSELNRRLLDRYGHRSWYGYAPASPERGAEMLIIPLRQPGPAGEASDRVIK